MAPGDSSNRKLNFQEMAIKYRQGKKLEDIRIGPIKCFLRFNIAMAQMLLVGLKPGDGDFGNIPMQIFGQVEWRA